VYGESTATFFVDLQRNLLIFLVTPGSDNDSTSTCLWLWSEGTLALYWPVGKFDLILIALSVLNTRDQPVLLFGANTNISAIHGLIADISQIF